MEGLNPEPLSTLTAPSRPRTVLEDSSPEATAPSLSLVPTGEAAWGGSGTQVTTNA